MSKTFTYTTVLLCLCLSATGFALGWVQVAGSIETDTAWSAQDTILVTDMLTVQPGATLTITPGAVVLFRSGILIWCKGRLLAEGTPEAPITFSSAADTLGGSPGPYDWSGLQFYLTSGNRLSYCEIRYAADGVKATYADVEIDHCTIEYFYSRGVYVLADTPSEGYQVEIQDCLIRQTEDGAVGDGIGVFVLREGSVSMTRCIIQNCLQGLEVFGMQSYQPRFEVFNCLIQDNTANGIYVHTSG